MAIEALAFLVWSPFNARDYERFGIDALRDRFPVFVLDCTSWLAPAEVACGPASVAWFPGYRRISSAGELAREMAALSFDERWAVFDMLGTCRESYRARGRLKAAGCARIEIGLGRLPAPRRSPREWSAYLWRMGWRLPAAVLSRLRRRRLGPPDIAIVGGRVAEASLGRCAGAMVRTHSLDYETYLRMTQASDGPATDREQAHILYLDEDFVFHQDYAHLRVPYTTSGERFFPPLNRLFSEVERRLGLPVVVAAHPRSRYERVGDCFGGRRLVKGRTPELVRDAALVLAHSSTAISFAVLFSRPIVLLTSDDIDRDSSQVPFIHAFAERLGSPVINIDRPAAEGLAAERLLAVDHQAYSAYRHDFLKSTDSNESPMWTTIAAELAGFQRSRL